MKNPIIRIVVGVLFTIASQTGDCQRTCGTLDLNMDLLKKTNPTYYQNILKISYHLDKYTAPAAKSSSGVITIPVIVHVLWHTETENISDAQIQSQINVLNEDYRFLNSNKSNIPAEFLPYAADFEIEFSLAEIIRKETSKTEFVISDNDGDGSYNYSEEQQAGIKFEPYGSPAISTDYYLNIWVCNLDETLGYTTYPGGNPATDGAVIAYNCFGRTGTLRFPFNQGRTTTHEIGHWLNIEHIFGSMDDNCTDSDYVDDTPNQQDYNTQCPRYPHVSCGSSDMFMNYMDYTNDACMNMFTQGQKERARALFSEGGIRENIICTTTENLKNTDVTADKTLTDCFVSIENVTVRNNSKLIVDAAKDVVVAGEFEVALGSELEIR